jgi:hypothetical protein
VPLPFISYKKIPLSRQSLAGALLLTSDIYASRWDLPSKMQRGMSWVERKEVKRKRKRSEPQKRGIERRGIIQVQN